MASLSFGTMRTFQNAVSMRIPVFVSAPTTLNPEQEAIRNRIVKLLGAQGLEPDPWVGGSIRPTTPCARSPS